MTGVRDPRSDFFRFDPARMRWTELSASGPAPPARHQFHMAFAGGRLYIAGGLGRSERLGQSEAGAQLNDLFAFDPASLTWTDLTSAVSDPRPAQPLSTCLGVGMAAVDDRLYVTCGGSASVFHTFDPAAMAWTDLGGAVRGSAPRTPVTAGSAGLLYAFLEGEGFFQGRGAIGACVGWGSEGGFGSSAGTLGEECTMRGLRVRLRSRERSREVAWQAGTLAGCRGEMCFKGVGPGVCGAGVTRAGGPGRQGRCMCLIRGGWCGALAGPARSRGLRSKRR